MARAPLISTRPALIMVERGLPLPAVLVLNADGSVALTLDARQIDSFLASVRASADLAMAAHDQQAAASPSDRALLQAQPEGRA